MFGHLEHSATHLALLYCIVAPNDPTAKNTLMRSLDADWFPSSAIGLARRVLESASGLDLNARMAVCWGFLTVPSAHKLVRNQRTPCFVALVMIVSHALWKRHSRKE